MAHDPNTKLPLDITGDDKDYADDVDYPNFTLQPFPNDHVMDDFLI